MRSETLIHVLRRRAHDTPDGVAARFLLDGESEIRTWSWSELDRKSRAVAATLQQQCERGDRVLLLFPQGLDYLAALYGSMMAGVLAVPLQPPGSHRAAHALPKLEAIAADGGIAAALTVASQRDAMQHVVEQSDKLCGLPWVAVDAIDEEAANAWNDPHLKATDLAYLQYTSGSTSTPKGVMVSHANLTTNLTDFDLAYGHDSESVMVSWLPTFHDLGLVYGVFLPLWVGFPTVLLDPLHFLRRPLRWLEAIHRFRGTHAPAPNFAFDLLTAKSTPAERAALDLTCWKVALNGAEPIRHDTEVRFVEAFSAAGVSWSTISHAYGMSESTAVIAKEPVGTEPVFFVVDASELEQHRVVEVSESHDNARILAGCGETVRETVVRIVETEHLTVCREGEVGEIWVGGPTRAEGYWNRPEETETGFFAQTSDSGEGPFLRTGDLGFVLRDQVVVTGRLKDMIIVRGENHYPQDLEWSAQQAHPAIRPSCVAAFPLLNEGPEAVGLAMEVYPDRVTDPEEVFAAVRTALGEHGLQAALLGLMPPRTIYKTSSGKIMRRRTRAALSDGSVDWLAIWRRPRAEVNDQPSDVSILQTIAGVEPSDVLDLLIEHVLVRAAAQLGFDDASMLDADVPLRELGFDSVAAVQLAETLSQDLAYELEATVLFDHPTAEALASFLMRSLGLAVAGAGTTATMAPAPRAPSTEGDLDGEDLAALLAAELDDL